MGDRAIDGRTSAALFAAAWIVAVAVGTHGIAYWDAADYVRLSIDGGPSGLLLGRPLFLAATRALTRAFLGLGLDPSAVEPLLRHVATAVSATAAPGLAILATRLGLERRAAIASGIALALSPSFAHTAHQVLTDGPALSLSIAALAIAAGDARGRLLGSSVLLGAAITTRETAGLHLFALAALVARPGGRRRPVLDAALAIVVVSATVAAIVLVAHGGLPPSLVAWRAAMTRSSSVHPRTLAETARAAAFVVVIGPLPFALAALAWARREVDRRVMLVALPAALATLALVFYQDASFSPRYVLSTAPLGLLLVAGPRLARASRTWLVPALLVPLSVVPFATRRARAIAERGAAIDARLATLPAPALVLPGHVCPHARLAIAIDARRRGERRDLDLLCPGWDWPEDPGALHRLLDRARCEGRTLAIDVDEEAWVGERERPAREAARAYGAPTRTLAGFLIHEGCPGGATASGS
jgi:hypothetical protein